MHEITRQILAVVTEDWTPTWQIAETIAAMQGIVDMNTAQFLTFVELTNLTSAGLLEIKGPILHDQSTYHNPFEHRLTAEGLKRQTALLAYDAILATRIEQARMRVEDALFGQTPP